MSVRYSLLALLDAASAHGYQLRQEFESRTGATWPLNIGQVYTTLSRLERDGLVVRLEDSGDDGQHVYAITGAGRAELRRWFETPKQPSAPPRDELAIKLAMAVTTPGVEVRDVIQAQRAATMRRLQDYTRSREAATGDLPWLLVVDSLIFDAEAEVRWLDHCETRLARASLSVPTGAPAQTPSASPSAVRKAPVR